MEVGRIILGQERGLALQGRWSARRAAWNPVPERGWPARSEQDPASLLHHSGTEHRAGHGQGKRVQSRVPRRHRTGVASLWLRAWPEP